MAKYIELEAAKMAVVEAIARRHSAYNAIVMLPDVLEVVRCKDCAYRHDDDFCGGRGWPEQLVPDDGFCDAGKMKDGETENETDETRQGRQRCCGLRQL